MIQTQMCKNNSNLAIMCVNVNLTLFIMEHDDIMSMNLFSFMLMWKLSTKQQDFFYFFVFLSIVVFLPNIMSCDKH